MVDRRHLSAFARVVEMGSFSRAAEAQGVGQPAISKLIEQLERELGATLLLRSTRRLTLTAEGERVLVAARRVLDAYEDLAAAGDAALTLAGTVRVTCPNALASCFFVETLANFLREHPAISVQLRITDAALDLEDNDIDLAIRAGDPRALDAKAKFLGYLPRIVAASTRYLDTSPAPRDVAELANHQCVIVGRASPAEWRYVADGRSQRVEVRGNIVVDSHLALLSAVSGGFGLGLAASFIFMEGDAMRPGLRRVLPDVAFEPLPLNLLYRPDRHIPARVRRLIDYVADAIARQSWIERA